MRLHHFTLVFAIVAIAIMATLTLSTKELSSVYEQKTWLDHAFDQAIDAAAGALVELDSGNELVLHKEEAIECFFQALYAGMGILDNPEQQEQLQAYVPLFAIIANDGCYLYVSDMYKIAPENNTHHDHARYNHTTSKCYFIHNYMLMIGLRLMFYQFFLTLSTYFLYILYIF